MAYRSILVHVDNARSCPARLRGALELTTRFDASLSGIYVSPVVTGLLEAGHPPPYELVETLRADQERRAREAEDAFMEMMLAAGLPIAWNTARAAYFSPSTATCSTAKSSASSSGS